ncbi:DUF4169 family protein [Enhydrobacter sp.]|jgi:hypothetical protein|uniref:DUF4169 family protein n=1 Tax=Enhydrobacter sp. TaxID=1894999 RepID=UPI00260C5107|nr:DUF4169 family protein [Enhydrobacter sp.]WIM11714.1 MAG: hypothetical protein OJF58_002673 [Enhydrobacter sp.]
MADIVNLRRARKERARRERDSRAQTNRLRFGRTKAEKAVDKDRAERQREALDGKQLRPNDREED